MTRFPLSSVLLLVIYQALPSTSFAIQCSAAAVASGGASAILQAASAETCSEYWSGNLPFAGKEATIRTQVSLPLPAGFDVQVQEGLLAADDTLRKLGSGVGLGQSVVVIISGVDPLNDAGNPWNVVGYAEFLDGHCFFVVTPNTWRDPAARQELKITMAHEFFRRPAFLTSCLLQVKPMKSMTRIRTSGGLGEVRSGSA